MNRSQFTKLRTTPFIISLAVSILLISYLFVYAQEFGSLTSNDAVKFRGVWEGSIEIVRDQKSTVKIKVKITDSEVAQYFFEESKNDWRAVNPDVIRFTCDRNNAMVYWHNQGGVWSETQVYSISFLNNGELDLVWLRHVNNIRKNENNQTWNLFGRGKLVKK
jgi:predicted secreted protein